MKKDRLELAKEIFKDFLIPLVVGISSVMVAVNANKIYETQALIAKSAEAPTIDIQEKCYESKHEIEIYFLDGKFENPQIEIVTFLKCDTGTALDTGWTVLEEFEFPIVNYYTSYDSPDNKYGLIATIINDHSYTSYNNLQNNLKKYYDERETQTLSTTIQSYLKINYQNLLEEQEEVYYKVDSRENPSVVKINNNLGKDAFKRHKKMVKAGEDIFLLENEGTEIFTEEIYQWMKE